MAPGHKRSARTVGMAARTPKLLASYESSTHDRPVALPGDDHGLAAQLRIIPLLDRRVKRIHVYVDDFSHIHLPTMLFQAVNTNPSGGAGYTLAVQVLHRGCALTP
jgi:hypothetical protein